MKTKKKLWRTIVFYVLVVLLVIILLFPLLIMLNVALKQTSEAIAYPPTFFPREITFRHFRDIFNPNIFPLIRYFGNSLYISLVTAVVVVLIGILAGYALSRLRFKAKNFVTESFFLVYMFSGILLIVPLFRLLSSLGLRNTREAVIICMITQTMPTAIYMTQSYFSTVPRELDEAAWVDGLSRFKTIFRIVAPLSLPGIASVFIYALMIAWNDFLFVSIFIDSSEMMTLTLGLYTLFNTSDYIWGQMMAASLITSLPVVIMYAWNQSFIRKGQVEGGVKG